MKPGQFIIICLSLTAFFISQKSEGQTISGTNLNRYYKATAIINNGTHNTYSYSGITLESITGLSTGDRVLIIQMKGATINQANNSNYGNISSIANTGKYEFSSICGFLNNTIVLSNHLLHDDYDVSMVQVVRVPVFNQDIFVTGTLSPTPWNASTGLGGVLAFEVNGTLSLAANINADGAGFTGGSLVRFSECVFTSSAFSYAINAGTLDDWTNGAYKGEGLNVTNINYEGGKGKQSNGGGGGNNHNTGGGGGGNYGGGGRGGMQDNPTGCSGTHFGIGGASLDIYGYDTSMNKIFLGGGGGSGHANNAEGTPGGNGGGIIYIKSNQIIGNSYTISANGSQGLNAGVNPSNASKGDGGGGGGGGGTVLLNVTSYSGSVTIEAKGANGNNSGFQAQCPGPGGGGGGGIIWYAGAVPPTTNVIGGSAGTITSTSTCNGGTNDAASGSPGLVKSGFVAPQGTNTINCSILPLDLLKQFSGKRHGGSIRLNWTFTNVDNVQKVILERKTGNEQFKKVTEQFHPSTVNGFYTDEEINSNATYRLIVYALSGERQYSNHVFFETGVAKTFNLYPNPATSEVTIQLPANVNGRAGIVVTDVNGRRVQTQQIIIPASQTNTKLDLKDLPAGIYHLRLEINGEVYSAKLIKQ
ncbi:T9SS type A sorting domain-containing protein [Lacibacter sp. H407]|uniref:T9SS type A sorting domain-containing protein n=1 Tax=Lacibacter sp. H407 TaxID=3133423 RepID=UPI0030C6575C